MLRLTVPFILAALALPATALAAPAPETSWGRAGVTFDDYRGDATACLREAAATDLTGTEPANALVLASRQIETILTNDFAPMVGGGFDRVITTVNAAQQAKMAARPDYRFRQARDILQANLDQCLGARGYQRFRLSDDQRRRLRHLSLRGAERQVYMHSLASDPQVLASQTVQLPATH